MDATRQARSAPRFPAASGQDAGRPGDRGSGARGRRLGAQVPRALGAGRRLAGRDGRPGARRRRQPELDPVN